MKEKKGNIITEEDFWEIVSEYPEKTKGYDVGSFKHYPEKEINRYSFNDGQVTFKFDTEQELRKILEDFIQ